MYVQTPLAVLVRATLPELQSSSLGLAFIHPGLHPNGSLGRAAASYSVRYKEV